MDWLVACGLGHFSQVREVMLSYDIACQYFPNLKKRMKEWPKERRLPSTMHLRPLIPGFHYPVHIEGDHDEFDTRLCDGLGITDLEAIERLWGAIGMLGLATKTMAPASRQLVLDDNFGFYNWLKYINHGKIQFAFACKIQLNKQCLGAMLLRKYKQALMDRNTQTEAHRGFTASLPDELTKEWESHATAWDAAEYPKAKTMPSPYEVKGECTYAPLLCRLSILNAVPLDLSEAAVHKELSREEDVRKSNGGLILHSTGADEYIVMGLQLEELQ